MFVNFSSACFRLLVRALTVAILIPSLIHEQYYAFIVTVCVFSLGQMIEYISFMETSVSKMVHVICSLGCLLAICVTVICFVYFAGLAMTADAESTEVNGITEQVNAPEIGLVKNVPQVKISTPETVTHMADKKNASYPYLTFVVWVTFLVSLYYVAIDFLVWVVAVLNGWKLKRQYSKSILHI